ncbi:unnamed protein product [Cylindrotheca closterium]|uniref:Embryonic stem cell-specific 5-hydroxymethylcytosine-binding protein n=1 Tax=Cylindrotheca closterium TaxID=2856 RepID=A0AAD2FC64_9STRA|nr:unnamed protein product [Cylindrotheca closterium]
MCGRAAQTFRAAKEAGLHLGALLDSLDNAENGNADSDENLAGPVGPSNYNMCPGMSALVMWKDGDNISIDQMAWGLITKAGTEKKPLPVGKQRMSLHFQNLMFNARSDTLFSKPSFTKLTSQKRACIVALDGYFEWKNSPLGSGKGNKQPYYVYRTKSGTGEVPPLLIAGLWTQVSTGIPEEPELNSFTMLTTEPCEQIKWLHDRMPLCLWDKKSCMDWLENPSPSVLKSIDALAAKTEKFDWHMVSTEMSNLKFRGEKAIQAIKPPPSVLSFFSNKSKTKPVSTSPARDKAKDGSKISYQVGSSMAAPSPKQSRSPKKASFPPKACSQKQNDRPRTKQTNEPPAKRSKITSFFQTKE